VRLAPGDHERMSNLGPALIDEFTQLVQQHAAAQHYSFAGGISIALERDAGLGEGLVVIDSENVKGQVAWSPVLDIGGKRYPLTKSRTVIGRGSDADITIDDTGTSRRHVEILWDGKRGPGQRSRIDERIEAQRAALSKAPLRRIPSSRSGEPVSSSACWPSLRMSTSSPTCERTRDVTEAAS
jgi:hypothetical protein